ncbi:MAG: crossover junction endodeoxyribonuclease RuvC [Bacteroidia bacterium]|nr:crossover junction endodeoxyribonuclease RuvC [Bacteroidia bacterium]
MVQPASRLILGIDPGTAVTGYGLVRSSGRRLELVACGVIQLGRVETGHPEKLKRIYQRIAGLIEEFRPDEMAIEAPFYGKNPQSMLKLGRAQGVAMAAGMISGLGITEYAPRKVKTAVTGNGNASKEQVFRMLQRLLKFEETPKYLDATDALAVAVCHAYQGELPAAQGKSGDWAAFIRNNPGRVVARNQAESDE